MNIAEHSKTVRLGDITQKKRGISYGIVQPGTHENSGVPIIRVANIRNGEIDTTNLLKVSKTIEQNHERTRLHGGELLITIVGTVGETAIVPDQMKGWNVARAVAVIPVEEEVGPYWVKLSLCGSAARKIIQTRLNTTVQATLNLRDLADLPIPMPPPRIRREIVGLLGSLDDKINLNRRTNETLEAMARALFRDWFVDFGPTWAKMAGQTPYLTPEIWELFPDRLDDEGKPEGWRSSWVGELASLNACSWSRQNYPETIEYLDLSSVKFGIVNDLSRILAKDAPSRAQRILRIGETVVGTVRPGNGSYAYIDRAGLTGSTGFACFYSEDEKFREFIYLALTSKENIDRLAHLADGAAYPAVRPDAVADTPCVLSDDAVEAFHGQVCSWMNKISAHNAENISLSQLRDLLLPKLMSGEIRIRDAEKMVEDAL